VSQSIGPSWKHIQLRVAINSAAVGRNPNCVSQSIGRSGFSHLTASRNKVGRSGKQSPMCVAGNRTQLETHPIASLDIHLMADGPPLSGGTGNSGVMGLYIGVGKVHYQSSFRNDPGFQISIKTLVHLHLKTLVHLRISYISQMDSCDTNSTGIYACLHSCRSFLLTDFNILQTVLVVGSLGDRHFEE
jgi:hypothetical protein